MTQAEYDDVSDIILTLDNLTYTELQEMDWQDVSFIKEVKGAIDKGNSIRQAQMDKKSK